MKHLLLTVVFLTLFSCDSDDGPQFADLTVNVTVNMEGSPLVLNDKTYTNNGNTFVVEKFLTYLTGFRLYRPDGSIFDENESFHLVRAENGSTYQFTMKDVPVGEYSGVRFFIGVDEPENLSIDQVGDLDPTNQMAWNWNVGYKYVLMEGRMTVGADEVGLVYHIGFTENVHTILDESVSLPVSASGGELNITLEVAELFRNPNPVNMAELNNVQFDKDQVAIIVENYKNGFATVD